MTFGVLLAGSGVYDGSEIHEAVFTLLAIDEAGHSYKCYAPDKDQLHVIDHTKGEPAEGEARNVLVESARIARGEVEPVTAADVSSLDGLVIPGGFGAAKNLNQWAVSGPDGPIDEDVKKLILAFLKAGKPVAALCMGPTVVAKALEGSDIHAELTVGTTQEASPYDIGGISGGMESIGAKAIEKTVREVHVDTTHKIVTAPCYMMEASVKDIRNNAKQAVDELIKLATGEDVTG